MGSWSRSNSTGWSLPGRCVLPPGPELISPSPIRFTRGRSSPYRLCWVRRKPLFGHHQGEGEKRPICPDNEACASPVTNITMPSPASTLLHNRFWDTSNKDSLSGSSQRAGRTVKGGQETTSCTWSLRAHAVKKLFQGCLFVSTPAPAAAPECSL